VSNSKSSSATPDAEEASRAVAAATEAADRAVEQWVANVRLIEKLRLYIHERLSRGEYESEEDEQNAKSDGNHVGEKMQGVESTVVEDKDPTGQRHGDESLYPVLKMDIDADENTRTVEAS